MSSIQTLKPRNRTHVPPKPKHPRDSHLQSAAESFSHWPRLTRRGNFCGTGHFFRNFLPRMIGSAGKSVSILQKKCVCVCVVCVQYSIYDTVELRILSRMMNCYTDTSIIFYHFHTKCHHVAHTCATLDP